MPKSIDFAKYWHEPKLDGIRLQVHLEFGTVMSFTRASNDWTGKIAHIEAHLEQLDGLDLTVLDCEAVYLDPDTGRPDFQWTSSVMLSSPENAVRKQFDSGHALSLVVFDIQVLNGTDVRHLDIEDRRELAASITEQHPNEYLRLMWHAEASEEQHLQYLDETGEGSVLKLKGAAYGKGWHKWKAVADADVVVMGSTPGLGKYEGKIGAIVFGQYKMLPHVNGAKPTPHLARRGQCSGMSDEVRFAYSDAWIGRVMTIEHYGVHPTEGFRTPQFKAFREDKPAEACVWD